jgi:hypothetical protein
VIYPIDFGMPVGYDQPIKMSTTAQSIDGVSSPFELDERVVSQYQQTE